jgi:Calcineurin-like phosphoesterase
LFIVLGALAAPVVAEEVPPTHPPLAPAGAAFTLLISSDPQLTWWRGGADHQCDAKTCGPKSNEAQVSAMNAMPTAKWPDGRPVVDLRGVIINGDLTAFFHPEEEEQYKSYWESKLKLQIYPGLGNHDYSSNVNDCYGFSADRNMCAKEALNYLWLRAQKVPGLSSFDGVEYVIQGNPIFEGSFAYSFDIGAYHFVQLNLQPGYRVTLPPGPLNPVAWEVKPAYSWLRDDLSKASAAGQKIVVNMHDADAGVLSDDFNDAVDKQNVVAVFAGHIHEDYGRMGSLDKTWRPIPWFRSGSAECYRFIAAEFKDNSLTYGVVNSSTSQPVFEAAVTGCDARGKFNNIDYSDNDALDEADTITYPPYPLASVFLEEYKSGNGAQAFDRLHPHGLGTIETSHQDWTSGWTTMEPFCSGGAAYLFEYKSHGNRPVIDQVVFDANGNPSGTQAVWKSPKSWTSGWSLIRPFTSGGRPYLFEYKGDGKGTTIDQIETDSNGVPIGTHAVWSPSKAWSSGWTIIEPFTVRGRVFLFEYKGNGKGTDIDVIDTDSNGNPTGTSAVLRPPSWTSGWSVIRPFFVNHQPYLFEYRDDTGTAQIDRIDLDPNGVPTGFTRLWRTKWTSGWTAIRPLSLSDGVYLFEYKRDAGTVAVDKVLIGPNGQPSGTEEIWRARKPWTDGWTTIEPFNNPALPSPMGCAR